MLSVELSSCYVFRRRFFVKRVKCSTDCSAIFLFTTKTTQPRPPVFSVTGALTCNCAALLTSSVDKSQNSSKFGQQWLVMVNYTCAFSQSERGKYFEWIIMYKDNMQLTVFVLTWGMIVELACVTTTFWGEAALLLCCCIPEPVFKETNNYADSVRGSEKLNFEMNSLQ